MNTLDDNFSDWNKEEYVEHGKPTRKCIWQKIIYKDSVFRAVLLFVFICTVNIVSVYPLNTGYWYFVEPVDPVLPSVVGLAFQLLVCVFLLVYTIMCCRHRLITQLSGITAAFGVVALNSLFTSGIFFPVFNAATLVFRYITNGTEIEGGESFLIIYIINIASLIAYAFIAGYATSMKYDMRAKTRRMSLCKITAILSVVAVAFLVIYGFAFAKYEYEEFDKDFYVETPGEFYVSKITSEQKKTYDGIKIGDDVKQVDKELIENGFLIQKNNYEDYISNCLFSYNIDEYLEEKNPEIVNGNRYAIYSYINGMEDPDSYDDVISCIIVSFDSDYRINYKLYIPDANGSQIDGLYFSYKHGKQTKKWYDKIEKGDSVQSTLDFIRSTGAYIIEDEKYTGETKENTYKIILDCYYPLKVDFEDFLFNRYADSVNYSYDIELSVIDGVVTEKKIINPWE